MLVIRRFRAAMAVAVPKAFEECSHRIGIPSSSPSLPIRKTPLRSPGVTTPSNRAQFAGYLLKNGKIHRTTDVSSYFASWTRRRNPLGKLLRKRRWPSSFPSCWPVSDAMAPRAIPAFLVTEKDKEAFLAIAPERTANLVVVSQTHGAFSSPGGIHRFAALKGTDIKKNGYVPQRDDEKIPRRRWWCGQRRWQPGVLTMASVVRTPPLRAFRNALIKKNARAHLFELGTFTQSTCTRFLSRGLGLSRFGCLAPLAEGVLCAGRGLLFAKSPKKPTPKAQVTLSTQKKHPN